MYVKTLRFYTTICLLFLSTSLYAQKKVLFIGDSHIVQGNIVKAVEAHFEVESEIWGWNGASARDFLEQNIIPKQKYHLCIVSLGTNRAKDTGSYQKLIRKIKKYQTRLVLVIPNQVYYDTHQIRQTIHQISKSLHIPVWDFYHYTYVTNLMENPRLMKPDRVHLTPEGYLLQGRLLCEFLEKVNW